MVRVNAYVYMRANIFRLGVCIANGASASSSSRKRTAEDGLVKKAAKKVKE